MEAFGEVLQGLRSFRLSGVRSLEGFAPVV